MSVTPIKVYIARLLLALCCAAGGWVAFQPSSYSISPWMPYSLMGRLGLPYSWWLAADHLFSPVAHFAGGLLLAPLLHYALPARRAAPGLRRTAAALVAAGILIAVELVQAWIGRGFSAADLAIGGAGIAAGCGILSLLNRRGPA